MEYNFSIEKLRQKQVSGNCFPYLDKEYYEVNEALGEILREFERLNPLLKNQLTLDFNKMEYQTYVGLMLGKTTGENIKTETAVIKFVAGISLAISVLAPVFTISVQQWQTTRYLSSNQLIETAATPGFSLETDFSNYLEECELVTNYLESKGLISFQKALHLFPEIEKNDLFECLFFIND